MKFMKYNLPTLIKQLKKKVHELTNEGTKLESLSGTLATQIKMHEERYAEIENNINGIGKEKRRNSDNIKKCEKKVKDHDNELKTLLKVEQNMNKEMKCLGEKRDEIYRKKNDCEASIDKILTKLETNKDFVIGLRTKAKNMEETLKEAFIEIESYKIDIEPEAKLPSLEELKETVYECERKMRSLEPN